jgi:3-hydroxyacyl-[acyl-carrier-protein] dehydratase
MDGTAKQQQEPAGTALNDGAPKGYALDTVGIMRKLPHRYPFLMIDRVVEIVPGQSAIGVKNVSINEFYFQGHFPHVPLMPGVLVVEAMAQTAAVLVLETIGGAEIDGAKGVYFMSVEGAKFRRPVSPGDQLRIHVSVDRHRGDVWKFAGVARVDGAVVAEATYTAMVTDRTKQV